MAVSPSLALRERNDPKPVLERARPLYEPQALITLHMHSQGLFILDALDETVLSIDWRSRCLAVQMGGPHITY
jgi:hypothetical protein